MADGFRIPDLIAKKRDGKELVKEEIEYFIKGIVNGNVNGSQLGAMLMAIFLKDMSQIETGHLTNAMVHSGETLSWPTEWSTLMVDKHSTGGVGDKISLILAPALAACGLKVPMISGRGLGHTGGTLDKLESIPGFKVSCSQEKMIECLQDVGCCIVSQTATLVPADKIMYETRDISGTVESLPLACSSIVSKKIAENLHALVLDVKCGKGASMKTEDKARKLAKYMTSTCNLLGTKAVALLTKMDNPIGNYIGNALEVKESIDCLHGNGPDDIKELVYNLGGHLLQTAGRVETSEAGNLHIEQVINNGSAISKFCQMMQSQGVDKTVAVKLCEKNADIFQILKLAQYSSELTCLTEGYVHAVDSMQLALVSCELGAGRTKAGSPINHGVGIELKLSIGQRAEKGCVWIKVYHDDLTLSDNVIVRLQGALTIKENQVLEGDKSRIIDIIH